MLHGALGAEVKVGAAAATFQRRSRCLCCGARAAHAVELFHDRSHRVIALEIALEGCREGLHAARQTQKCKAPRHQATT